MCSFPLQIREFGCRFVLAASSRAGRPGTASGVLRYEREFGSKPQNSHSYSLETASKQWVSAPNPSQKDPRILRSHLQKDPHLLLPSQSDHPVAVLPNIMAIVAMVHKAHSTTFFPAERRSAAPSSFDWDRPGHTRGASSTAKALPLEAPVPTPVVRPDRSRCS